MGKLIQVKASASEVSLPPLGIAYLGGEVLTLTDREYAALDRSQMASIILLQDHLADPIRALPNPDEPHSARDAYKLMKQYVDNAIQGIKQAQPGGGTSVTFVHQQQVASASWVITHGLGCFPSVTITDSAGRVVYGDVTYPDESTAVVTFSAPFSGRADLV